MLVKRYPLFCVRFLARGSMNMESIIEKFYYGKIVPSDFPPSDSEKAQSAMERYQKMYDAFWDKLDEPMHKELMNLMDMHTETSTYDCADNFVRGYRLGALMMLDVLQGE